MSRIAWMGILAATALTLGTLSVGHGQQPQPNGAPQDGLATAVFAGGCFWCMEPPFDKVDGVVATTSGYSGGTVVTPTYQQVSSGRTGHKEVVQVRYDPKRVSYPKLLEVYWHQVDPLDAGGQFCDRGNQYATAIFVATDEERRLAEQSKAAVEQQLKQPVATPILPAGPFYPAEEYHQDYYQKNPVRYHYYRFACGRDRRLEQVWGGQPAG